MPVEFIKPLCDMGHNLVAPTAILEAISRESGRGA
jgi:hypothetical protein